MVRPDGIANNCAHRGASAHAPENTLAALERAVALGAGMAEIDVQLTADGRLAAFHDEFLERTSTGRGPLTLCTMDALKKLDAGSWYGAAWAGEAIPELSEVLAMAHDRLRLNIELKPYRLDNGRRDMMLRELQRQLDHEPQYAGPCVVTSFDTDLIDELRSREPGLQVGYILGAGGPCAWALKANVDLLSVEKGLVDAAFCNLAAQAGKSVHVWTVNDTEEMRRFLAMGVGVIITNHPERFPASA